jgi:hypothetical protein
MPVDATVGALVEIACDESGFSGTNLLHTATPVITHASVDLSVPEAVELIGALRSGLRFSPQEFKSGQFLRDAGARNALAWFLTALRARAHVHLIDKEFFLVTRIVDLFLIEPSYGAGTRLSEAERPAALALYRAGRRARTEWRAFLAAFVDTVRIKKRRPDDANVDRFFAARDALRRTRLSEPADAVLAGLDPRHIRAILTRIDDDDRTIPPPLEPLLPALAETVLFWSGGERQILVIHDEQSALTADRLTRLRQALADFVQRSPVEADHALPPGASPLAGLVMVDSRDDPRVQIADLLAGIARTWPKAIDDAPLRPLLSPTSLRDPADATVA